MSDDEEGASQTYVTTAADEDAVEGTGPNMPCSIYEVPYCQRLSIIPVLLPQCMESYLSTEEFDTLWKDAYDE